MIDDFPFPSGSRGRPSTQFAYRREHDPLGPVRLPSGDVARLATRYADVVALLSDPRFSSDPSRDGAPRMLPGLNPTPGPGLPAVMDPPEHTRLRRLLTGTLTEQRIAAWRPRIRERASEIISACPDEFDFVADVAFVYSSPGHRTRVRHRASAVTTNA
jgi:cytochrome P450